MFLNRARHSDPDRDRFIFLNYGAFGEAVEERTRKIDRQPLRFSAAWIWASC
jgi:hypothetical protein